MSRITIGRVLDFSTDSVTATGVETRLGEVQVSPTANTVLDRLKTIATLIGEVQASPTENTILDRLKDLLTGITLADSIVGQTHVHKSFDWVAATGAAQDLWTPAAGNRFVITDFWMSLSASCEVRIYDETDSLANRFLEGLFAQYGGVAVHLSKPWPSAAINQDLKVECSAASGWMTVAGYETT